MKFKLDLQEGDQRRQDLDKRIRDLERALQLRDVEIQRLGKLYQGGQNFEVVKVTFDRHTAEEQIQTLSKQNEFVNQENHRLETEM